MNPGILNNCRWPLLLALLAGLSGCVATSAHMANAQGGEFDCSKWGVGLILAPLALYRSGECVKDMQASGYHTIEPEPSPVTAAVP
jgi:hypothetical protein